METREFAFIGVVQSVVETGPFFEEKNTTPPWRPVGAWVHTQNKQLSGSSFCSSFKAWTDKKRYKKEVEPVFYWHFIVYILFYASPCAGGGGTVHSTV